MRKYLFLLLILFLLNACVPDLQKVSLAPAPQIVPIDVGHGVTVTVTAIDERKNIEFGYRGNTYGGGTKIITEQDVAGVIQGSVVESLRKKGFNPIYSQELSVRSLKIELHLIEYSLAVASFWSNSVYTKTIIKAVAVNNGKTYENIYRFYDEKPASYLLNSEVSEEFIIEKLLNEAISAVLQKLLDDNALIEFLAK